jgi:hypothetical protein
MEQNVGGFDRMARLVLGPLLVVAGLLVVLDVVPLGGSTLVTTLVALVLLVVGGVLLGTGGIQKCPINEAAGVDTYESQD